MRHSSNESLPQFGSPASRKRTPPVDMSLKPIQKEIYEVSYGTQQELGEYPLLVRAQVHTTPFIGKINKTQEPMYNVQLLSLDDNQVCTCYV